jgi:hypothetical protein
MIWEIEFLCQNRVPARDLVQTGRTVSHPLPSHEDRALDPELELDHLKGGGVAVAHQVPDQTTVVTNALGASRIRNSGGLNN